MFGIDEISEREVGKKDTISVAWFGLNRNKEERDKKT